MSRPRSDRPKLWIVAGPNGSGKSSLYASTEIEDFGGSVWIINPDLLTIRIRRVERLSLTKANLAAVKRIYAWLDASINAHQTVGVETVLSTEKYRALVLAAKERDFEIRLIYVLLDSVARNIERVKMRVAKGGHRVPQNKIIERHRRSLDQLPWFLNEADRAWIFDNSGATPKKIGEKERGVVRVDERAIPDVLAAAKKIAAP